MRLPATEAQMNTYCQAPVNQTESISKFAKRCTILSSRWDVRYSAVIAEMCDKVVPYRLTDKKCVARVE